MNEVTKTKKIRKQQGDTKALWKLFNSEINNIDEDTQIECIYRQGGERELCELCQSVLTFADEGFLACENKSCGIIYKDIVDQSAEWRFYGADDNSIGDPTRCGMPINPLLKESSFGCKVICPGKSSYEMRKIRRYTEWQSMPYREKSQYDEFQRITIIAHNSGIPKMIVEDAMRYHKKFLKQKHLEGVIETEL